MFEQVVVSGLTLGAIYALIALGFVAFAYIGGISMVSGAVIGAILATLLALQLGIIAGKVGGYCETRLVPDAGHSILIDRSIASGFIPWLMVRLPCGSRSMTSTRCPSSRGGRSASRGPKSRDGACRGGPIPRTRCG